MDEKTITLDFNKLRTSGAKPVSFEERMRLKAKDGDENAWNYIANLYGIYIKSIAFKNPKIAKVLDETEGEEYDNLYDEGLIGLKYAVDHFNPEKAAAHNTEFISYAIYFITYAMEQYCENLGKTPGPLDEEHIWNQDLVSIDREKRWGRQADTFERQVDGLLDFIERQPNPTAAAYYYVNGGRPFSIPEGNELLDLRSINALWETTAKKAVATLAAYVHYYKEGKPLYQRTHGLINEVNVTPEILRDYGDRLRKMAARLGMKFRIEDSKHFIRRVVQRRLPEEYVHRMIETVSKQAVASRMCQKRLDEGRSFDFLIADKQTCIVVKVYLQQDGDTLVANIATAFVYDGKAGNLAYDGKQYIYYLNDDNPSKEWEEAEVTAEWYGNETWSQGGTGNMEKFIDRNFDKEGNPLSYKAWLISNDNLKNNVKGEVRKKVNREHKKKGEEENNNNETNNNMKENIIKLNEDQLCGLIKESVRRMMLKEGREGLCSKLTAIENKLGEISTVTLPVDLRDIKNEDIVKITKTPDASEAKYSVKLKTGYYVIISPEAGAIKHAEDMAAADAERRKQRADDIANGRVNVEFLKEPTPEEIAKKKEERRLKEVGPKSVAQVQKYIEEKYGQDLEILTSKTRRGWDFIYQVRLTFIAASYAEGPSEVPEGVVEEVTRLLEPLGFHYAGVHGSTDEREWTSLGWYRWDRDGAVDPYEASLWRQARRELDGWGDMYESIQNIIDSSVKQVLNEEGGVFANYPHGINRYNPANYEEYSDLDRLVAELYPYYLALDKDVFYGKDEPKDNARSLSIAKRICKMLGDYFGGDYFEIVRGGGNVIIDPWFRDDDDFLMGDPWYNYSVQIKRTAPPEIAGELSDITRALDSGILPDYAEKLKANAEKKERDEREANGGLKIVGKIDLDKVDPKAASKKRWEVREETNTDDVGDMLGNSDSFDGPTNEPDYDAASSYPTEASSAFVEKYGMRDVKCRLHAHLDDGEVEITLFQCDPSAPNGYKWEPQESWWFNVEEYTNGEWLPYWESLSGDSSMKSFRRFWPRISKLMTKIGYLIDEDDEMPFSI